MDAVEYDLRAYEAQVVAGELAHEKAVEMATEEMASWGIREWSDFLESVDLTEREVTELKSIIDLKDSIELGRFIVARELEPYYMTDIKQIGDYFFYYLCLERKKIIDGYEQDILDGFYD